MSPVGDAAVQVRVEVVQVFGLAGIDVARDVEVVVVGRSRSRSPAPCASSRGNLELAVEHVDDLVDVLRAQAVLVAVLDEPLLASIMKMPVARCGVLLVDHHDAGRDAGAVEQVRAAAR